MGQSRSEIEDATEARDAYTEIAHRAQQAAPDAPIDGVIVQSAVKEGIEVLLGASRDPDFGPLVTVGSGGTAVEIVDNSTTLVPPFTTQTVIERLSETKVSERIRDRGWHSSLETLASLIVAVGDLSMRAEDLGELYLNPIIINENGVHAVDVLAQTV